MTHAIMARLQKAEAKLSLSGRMQVVPWWSADETQAQALTRAPQGPAHKNDFVILVQRFAPREPKSMDKNMDRQNVTLQ